MNRFFHVVALTLLCSAALSAQTREIRQLDTAPPVPVEGPALTAVSPAGPSPTASTVSLRYFDETLPAMRWNIPAGYAYSGTTLSMVSIGQRFTLPTDEGILDSVAVFIQRLPLGEIHFDVMRDTLLMTGNGKLLHWPNYYSTTGQVDTARLSFLQVDTSGFSMIRFNGKRVGKEFHVCVRPATVQGLTSAFSFITDSRKGLAADQTPENSRTTFLAVINGQLNQVHMYGFFQSQDTARNPRPYMVAFVTVEGTTSTGTAPVPDALALHAAYPNPASGGVSRIPFDVRETGHVTLDVHDALGRVVHRVHAGTLPPGRYERELPLGGLPAGVYYCRLATAGVTLTRPLLVAR